MITEIRIREAFSAIGERYGFSPFNLARHVQMVVDVLPHIGSGAVLMLRANDDSLIGGVRIDTSGSIIVTTVVGSEVEHEAF